MREGEGGRIEGKRQSMKTEHVFPCKGKEGKGNRGKMFPHSPSNNRIGRREGV